MPCIDFDLGDRRCVASVFRTVDCIAPGMRNFLNVKRERVRESGEGCVL